MTATIAKFFIIMTLAFEVLTATTGSAYYTLFGWSSATVLFIIILMNVLKKVHVTGRRQLMHA